MQEKLYNKNSASIFAEESRQEGSMEANQIKLLKILAKEIKKERKDKDKVISSLQSAKILTKKANFTQRYNHLNLIFSSSE